MKVTICSIGECMIEMANIDKGLYNFSIAGDTLNFSCYLNQRIFNKFYLTSIGNSDINKGVINFLKKKKINTDLVERISFKEIGLYIIKNKINGEKQFYYWRDDSAARYYFNNINISLLKKKYKFDFIYLTGITLSLLDDNNIDKFITSISNLRNTKSKIIFDFNIRIKRWSKKNLNLYLKKILPYIDILFCSGEDLIFWKNNNNIRTFENIIKKFTINHAIYRKNEEYNFAFYKNKKYMIKNKSIKKVIDTSGAGDGYNAAYLSNFVISEDPQLSLKAASELGKKIVMKKGAIVDVK